MAPFFSEAITFANKRNEEEISKWNDGCIVDIKQDLMNALLANYKIPLAPRLNIIKT